MLQYPTAFRSVFYVFNDVKKAAEDNPSNFAIIIV